ncbi:MAG: hypothetical protein K2W92_10300 [Alphaproteobacteria bacterium]|nr:hypothetical protein [Alphaproteobacteria bacterium]
MKTPQLLIYAWVPLSVVLGGCGRKEWPVPPEGGEITYSQPSKKESRPQSKRKSSTSNKDNWAKIMNAEEDLTTIP